MNLAKESENPQRERERERERSLAHSRYYALRTLDRLEKRSDHHADQSD